MVSLPKKSTYFRDIPRIYLETQPITSAYVTLDCICEEIGLDTKVLSIADIRENKLMDGYIMVIVIGNKTVSAVFITNMVGQGQAVNGLFISQ
jgi:Ni,Fe-hydrogenase III large subunit